MTRCTVTAIAPDGQRSIIEVEARSLNYAVIWYNYRAIGNSQGLLVPTRETEFEVEAAGKLYRTTWGRVLDWANRRADMSSSNKGSSPDGR